MRSLLIGTAVAVAMAAPAFAQNGPANAGSGQAPSTILLVPAQAPGGGGPGAAGQEPGAGRPGQPGMGQPGMMGDMMGRAEMMRHAEWMHDHMEGTSFRFRRGPEEIDVHCAANQPLPLCVSAAAALIDRVYGLREQQGSAGGDTGQGSGSGSSSSTPGQTPATPPHS